MGYPICFTKCSFQKSFFVSVLEYADRYEPCRKCPKYLLSGQPIRLRCRPERTLTAKNIEANFVWRTESDRTDADKPVLMKAVEVRK